MAEQERDKALQGSQQQGSTQSAGQPGGEDKNADLGSWQ